MARERKTLDSSNDSTGWLAFMPPPTFNPLNWWALSSQRATMLATLNNTRAVLEAWRAGADNLRAIIRQQQDETLRLLEAPLETAGEVEAKPNGAGEEAEPAKPSEATVTPAADLLVQPMIEMTRAYGRVGRAFIVAQRDTMRAFVPPSQPH